ncbi:MAG: serine hydrolase [Lewinellaceae bacterium]|nr:serine hydrolase [Lewinellaceae bacterium]
MQTRTPDLILLLLLILPFTSQSQSLYFPPLIGQTWATTPPEDLGWCTSAIPDLYTFLEDRNTKGFLVLQDGKIVLEKYFDQFTADSLWYWASAGKTLTSMLVGIAQEEGLLKISDPTSKYLGTGWTSLPPEKEALITIRHQITMTSGLDDKANGADCTDPNCLQYLAAPGTRWAYHNAPYTLLDQVIVNASGQTYNGYFAAKIRNKIGMNGLWLKLDYNNVYFSNARSMARYGLLLLNKGVWNTTPILRDTAYLRAMTHSSQDLNPAYGYLTWLNGQTRYMLPGLQLVLPGMLTPSAPADMYAALGKNGQILCVVPSQRLVVVRMGNAPDNSLVPTTLVTDLWKKLSAVICTATSTPEVNQRSLPRVYPNPAREIIQLELPSTADLQLWLFDPLGRPVRQAQGTNTLSVIGLPAGPYLLNIRQGGLQWMQRVMVVE